MGNIRSLKSTEFNYRNSISRKDYSLFFAATCIREKKSLVLSTFNSPLSTDQITPISLLLWGPSIWDYFPILWQWRINLIGTSEKSTDYSSSLQLDCQVRNITFLAIFAIYYFRIHNFPIDETGTSFGT